MATKKKKADEHNKREEEKKAGSRRNGMKRKTGIHTKKRECTGKLRTVVM